MYVRDSGYTSVDFHPVSLSSHIPLQFTYHVKHSKTALFETDPHQLKCSINNTPVHIVFASWPSEDDSTQPEAGDVVGVASINLSEFRASTSEPDYNEEGVKVSSLSGPFPIRSPEGLVVGEVQLRIELSRLPDDTIHRTSAMMNGKAHSARVAADRLRSSWCQTNSLPMKQDQSIQASLRAGSMARSTSTENVHMRNVSPISFQKTPRNREVGMDERVVSEMRYSNTSLEGFSPRTRPIDQPWDNCSDIAPSQPAGIRFDGGDIGRSPRLRTNSSHVTLFSIHCVDQAAYYFSYEKNDTESSRSKHADSTSSLRSARTNRPASSPRNGDRTLPILQCLLKELQFLRAGSDDSQQKFDPTQLDSLVQLLSNPMNHQKSSPPVGYGKVSTRVPRLQLPISSRRGRISHLATPRVKPPAPGQMVPKHCGWLRTTPVYHGPAQSSLVPRSNYAQALRLQKLKSVINTSQSFPSSDMKRVVRPIKPANRVGVSQDVAQPEVLESPKRLSDDVIKPRSSNVQTSSDSTSSKSNESVSGKTSNSLSPQRLSKTISSGQKSPAFPPSPQTSTCTPNLSKRQDMNRRDSSSDSTTSNSIQHTVSTQALASEVLPSESQNDAFRAFQPVQSNRSPQISTAHSKFCPPVHHPIVYPKEKLERLNLSSPSPTVSSPRHLGRIPSNDPCRSTPPLSPEQTVEKESQSALSSINETVYSEDYESSTSAEPVESIPEKIPPFRPIKQHSFVEKGDTSKLTDLKPSNQKETRQANDSIDVTSFTRVSTHMDRTASIRRDTRPPLPTTWSGGQRITPPTPNRNNNDVKTIDPVEMDEPFHEDEEDSEDFDIEAMRRRSSHDYVIGGSSVY